MAQITREVYFNLIYQQHQRIYKNIFREPFTVPTQKLENWWKFIICINFNIELGIENKKEWLPLEDWFSHIEDFDFAQFCKSNENLITKNNFMPKLLEIEKYYSDTICEYASAKIFQVCFGVDAKSWIMQVWKYLSYKTAFGNDGKIKPDWTIFESNYKSSNSDFSKNNWILSDSFKDSIMTNVFNRWVYNFDFGTYWYTYEYWFTQAKLSPNDVGVLLSFTADINPFTQWLNIVKTQLWKLNKIDTSNFVNNPEIDLAPIKCVSQEAAAQYVVPLMSAYILIQWTTQSILRKVLEKIATDLKTVGIDSITNGLRDSWALDKVLQIVLDLMTKHGEKISLQKMIEMTKPEWDAFISQENEKNRLGGK